MDDKRIFSLLYISIHASAKEATYVISACSSLSLFQSTPPRRRRPVEAAKEIMKVEFQSTPPRRRRLDPNRIRNNRSSFQSTPPRRRRPGCRMFGSTHTYFNPRLREGGDELCNKAYLLMAISIHASAKEATELVLANELMKVFQSTPPRRRRLCLPLFLNSFLRFQSTPPRGRRQCYPLRMWRQ